MTTHTELAATLPCPFCGLTHALKVVSAEDLANEWEDEPEPWMHSPSFAVVCDASRPNGPGGCGSQGGFKPTEAEAVENWNRRAAALSTERLAGGGEPEPFAWATFDGEGGYDLRLYQDNEGYRDQFIKRNGPQFTSWVLALYTTPPPQAERVPLSDGEIEKIARPFIRRCGDHYTYEAAIPENRVEDFARAIESAHGIGTPKEST